MLYFLDECFVHGVIHIVDVLEYIIGIGTTEECGGNARITTRRELDG